MRIRGKEVLRLAMKVGEVAASAPGDQNFPTRPVGVFEDCNAAAALAGFDRAHQPRRTATENQCIEGMSHLIGDLRAHM
jgi:hypothetical protein